MDAPQPLCAKAVSNLHVVTELGLEQRTRCAPREASAPEGTTTLECTAINDKLLGVSILRPAAAETRGLLKLRPDPLPIQFTGTTGG